MRAIRFWICCGLIAVGLAVARPAVAHVDLFAPNGAEVLEAGSVFTVRWEIEIAHNLQNWDLWYSTTSSSGPWIDIASNLPPGSGAVGSRHSYDWTIPDIASDDTWARVRMDNSGTDYYGVSDASFTIAAARGSDLTNNGFVDFEDLTVLLANWNRHVTATRGNLVNPATTPVNFEDLTVLLADWTGPGPAGSPQAVLGAEEIPEPSSMLLAMIAILSLGLLRRWRRRAA